MSLKTCRLDEGDCETEVRNEDCVGSKRGQSCEDDVNGAKEGQKEELEGAKVRRFFADPPWLRYSRLGSGSGMSLTFRKMIDERRKDEGERVVMRSESWHKG